MLNIGATAVPRKEPIHARYASGTLHAYAILHGLLTDPETGIKTETCSCTRPRLPDGRDA